MMGKSMRKPFEVIIGLGKSEDDDGDDMAMEPVTEEQADAGASLAKAVKGGDGGEVYSAVCAIIDMHMGGEEY